ncbi:MAG: DUF342 domain-containing protein [Lachnospiraceae bacterium]|nr:DUF342 domain-containing protein [Lachnospiraceae bacterium]
MANGYFQTDIRADGSYVILFPATEGGQPIKFEELEKYLISNKMTEYKKIDLKQACDAVQESGKASMMRVGQPLPYKIREEMLVFLSENKMTLTVRFYPPSVKGETMDPDEIVRSIQANGIKYGIDNVAIREYVSNRRYCTDLVFAQGKAPVNGHDAKVEYFFNTNTSLKPAMNEDGTVDYKNLDNISHVQEGQLLARITPEDPGTPGVDLFANVIKPPQVKTRKLNTGNNIRMSEDGLEIYSTVMGHANLVGGQVFVSDIYEIPADVDNSTGDVKYSGNVHVKGNVKTGFSITTEGDIIVDGVVEGASLKAGGQIILKRGVQGMQKAVLEAGGNICAKFIEGATVTSGGYIETESIMHSTVVARTEINVAGQKGFITGGRIQAGSKISAKKIGSPMGANTLIDVGMSPEAKERYNSLKSEIVSLTGELNKAYPILQTFMEKIKAGENLPAKNMLYVKQLAAQTKDMEQKIKERKAEFEQLDAEMSLNLNAAVEVRGVIYPGVEINIANSKTITDSERSFCKFVSDGADVVVKNL